MIKNALFKLFKPTLSLVNKTKYIPNKFNYIPRYNFSNSKPPGDGHKQHDHHDHSNCSHGHHNHGEADHSHNHHHHHHHHHNGQPCNHDHSQDNQETQIPMENMIINVEDHSIGETTFKTFTTKDSISILDKIKGNKQADNQQLLVLMFTCNVCQQRAIRSFTKNAYENGVVLIKCQGCQNVHLIADNLKWFEDEPTNIEGFSDVKKVTHSADVLKILQSVFEKSELPAEQKAYQAINKDQLQKNNKRSQDEPKQK